MKVSFDIKCSDYTNQPAYRVWVNGELMAERDYIIPDRNKFSHYVFTGFLDTTEANVRLESITPGVTFSYDNLELVNENT
tara:strand:- start:127 stop:366 length:240 start_codon:yes stop_codon:yes gene_type:complete